jgi:hypothetical protein
VDDAARVDGRQPGEEFACQPDELLGRRRGRACPQPVLQRGPFEVLHDHKWGPRLLADLVDRDDVFGTHGRQGPCLPQEALADLVTSEHVQADHLDRDLTPQRDILGRVHRPHAAAAQHAADDETADLSGHARPALQRRDVADRGLPRGWALAESSQERIIRRWAVEQVGCRGRGFHPAGDGLVLGRREDAEQEVTQSVRRGSRVGHGQALRAARSGGAAGRKTRSASSSASPIRENRPR